MSRLLKMFFFHVSPMLGDLNEGSAIVAKVSDAMYNQIIGGAGRDSSFVNCGGLVREQCEMLRAHVV